MAVARFDFGGQMFSLTYQFARLQRNLSKTAGLYAGQPRVLTILKVNAGCTLTELATLCDIGMPSLSVSVRNLEKAGLIRREGAGKSQHLFLTDDGLRRATVFHEAIDGFYGDLLADFGDEADELDRCVRRMVGYLQQYNDAYETRDE